MAKEYIQKIPKKPLFKRISYIIPDNYSTVYKNKGITDNDEQIMLFNATQFGGFRCKQIPSYIKNRMEFALDWFDIRRDNGFYNFKANSRFLSELGNIKIRPLKKIWNNQVVNEDEMHEYGFSDAELKESRDFLNALNKFYSSLRIGISIPASGITLEDRVNLARFNEIPFLVKKPKAGGRFFHPGSSFQRIASPLRTMLTINGSKTSEIDISAATLQFLGIVLKKYVSSKIMDQILSKDDPYQYFLERLNSINAQRNDKGEILREDLKTIIYTTVYSSKKTQKHSVDHKLRLLGTRYKYSEFAKIFPEFFNAVDALKLKLDFPPHIAVYREESKYAQKVLEKGCLELKLPIIPIHDSFITTINNIPKLKDIIDSTATELYGRHLSYKIKY